MIQANKGGVRGWLWSAWLDRKLRKSFRGLHVRGELPTGDAPVLVYANHSSFWDGFVAHALSRAKGWDGYCLMAEENLQRYRFLTHLGAFSIRRHEATSSLESLRYARGLLKQTGAAVFVFPEGELQPFDGKLRPLERGVEVLARAAGAQCLPIAIRCVMLEHELPDVLIDVGPAHRPEPLASMTNRLSALVRDVAEARSLAGYELLVAGARGVAERWDAVKGEGARA